ncbi:3-dehydroquinate dehydratase-1 [Trueperella bonasi]|uniref:3-dehydroquinate dehydratase n=1 Tax=Trueperella bonasi TaxID=312286 RepID=A0ABT9NGG3_9ACTO|nr:type I 3-dehydroquinate dehydratase [Trueperella bonasi]MDP9806496.1 3-dehydroquinate dehydratase-1 [Trueperella bonasi]
MIFDSPGRVGPAIIVPLVGTTAEVIVEEAIARQNAGADALEFRADYLLAKHPEADVDGLVRDVLRELFAQTKLPILFTVRSREQGGELPITPFRYRVLLATALDILMQERVPAERVGIDFEFHSAATPDLARRAAGLGYTPVVSHHDWKETPDAEIMYVMLDDMLKIPDAVAKLAVMACSEEDTARLLDVTKAVAGQTRRPLMTIAMGEAGQRSRLDGWKYGSIATFASAGATTAPGQPTLADLRAYLGRV